MIFNMKQNIYIDSLAQNKSSNVGENTKIWQYVIVFPNAKIGNNCNINSHCLIENDVIVGNNVTVKCGVYLWDGITIKDNVFIGPNVTFTNDFLPRSKQYPKEFLKTTIEKGASIGANATIIGGITIGEYAMIGAGSVVTKDIPSHNLVYGNPAILKGYVCECGNKLNQQLVCKSCHATYRKNEQSQGLIKNDI